MGRLPGKVYNIGITNIMGPELINFINYALGRPPVLINWVSYPYTLQHHRRMIAQRNRRMRVHHHGMLVAIAGYMPTRHGTLIAI